VVRMVNQIRRMRGVLRHWLEGLRFKPGVNSLKDIVVDTSYYDSPQSSDHLNFQYNSTSPDPHLDLRPAAGVYVGIHVVVRLQFPSISDAVRSSAGFPPKSDGLEQ
jgi:hypothetical protein